MTSWLVVCSISATRAASKPALASISATASSGLVVAYSAAGVCSNVGRTFTMTNGTGTCTVQYDQAGNASYNAATPVTETVTAQKASQTITVVNHAPATAAYGASFTVTATASPGYAFAGWNVTGGTIIPSASQATCWCSINVSARRYIARSDAR